MKRKLYKLIPDGDDAILVYRVDKNIGRLGVVFKNGDSRLDRWSAVIPGYIYNICQSYLHADQWERERGYTIAGKNCKIDQQERLNNENIKH